MNVRCPFCNQSFNLSRDYVAHAVEQAMEKNHKHHNVECINCRKMIKVPLKQMRHALPTEETE